VAEGRTWAEAIRCVTKPVFATTTVTAVNLGQQPGRGQPAQALLPRTFALQLTTLTTPLRTWCVARQQQQLSSEMAVAGHCFAAAPAGCIKPVHHSDGRSVMAGSPYLILQAGGSRRLLLRERSFRL